MSIGFRTFSLPIRFDVDERGRLVNPQLGEPVYEKRDELPPPWPAENLRAIPDYPIFRWLRR